MKKYAVEFIDDYTEWEAWAKEEYSEDGFWTQQISANPDQLKMCKRWKGKELTILQIEGLVDEVGDVILNKDTVTIYNGYA